MSCSRRSIPSQVLGVIFSLPLLLGSVEAAPQSFSEILSSRYSSLGPLAIPGIQVENFGVVDGRIYRGGQPDATDYRALQRFGIKTIIDLRADFEKRARSNAEAAGLKYINIPMVGQQTPTDAEATAFLKALADPGNDVVYVHCAGGRHRTGSMIAVYRMVQDGWTVDRAYDEMLKYDFYTAFGHKGYKTYVFDYFKRMTANPSSVPIAYVAQEPASATTTVEARTSN